MAAPYTGTLDIADPEKTVRRKLTTGIRALSVDAAMHHLTELANKRHTTWLHTICSTHPAGSGSFFIGQLIRHTPAFRRQLTAMEAHPQRGAASTTTHAGVKIYTHA